MSKILRRPMFRGGPVDSRGTGITSGLMDGGRVGYQSGDIVLGGDLYSKDDYTKFMTNYADNLNKNSALYKSIFTKDDDGEVVIDDSSKYSYENMFGQATGKSEKPQSVFKNVDTLLDSTSSFLPPPGGTQELGTALKSNILEDLKESKQFESTEPRGGGFDAAQYGVESENSNNNNEPSNTEISAQDLIKENAELFKELLGEGQKEKIKKARIGDASDYLLKFFEGSQKEGATVGSAAADVAGFATSRDSKTEKAIAANEKIDQTATVLAINDYISGKRSKEDIQKALSLAAATAQMKKGDVAGAVADYAKRNGSPPPVSVLKTFIRDDSRLDGKSIEEFDSTATKVEYSPGDENKVFIDTVTKEVFTFNKDNPNRISISG